MLCRTNAKVDGLLQAVREVKGGALTLSGRWPALAWIFAHLKGDLVHMEEGGRVPQACRSFTRHLQTLPTPLRSRPDYACL